MLQNKKKHKKRIEDDKLRCRACCRTEDENIVRVTAPLAKIKVEAKTWQ